MSTSFLPSKTLILLVAACLVWIGILSVAFLAFSGMSLSSGWIVAGALFFAVVAWVLVMFREIRGAITLPDTSATGERGEEGYDTDGKSTVDRPRAGGGRIFLGRRIMAVGRHFRSRPRKLRSKWQEAAGAPASR